jgi:tetraacyldisaccharide 4'-kinase
MIKPPRFWFETPALMAHVLRPPAFVYEAIQRLRWAIATPFKSEIPIICVGNTGLGGAGKTPTALAIGRLLDDLTISFKYLTRGYGGHEQGPLLVNPLYHKASQVGDEPLLLAKTHPTIMAKNRIKGLALIHKKNTQVIVMDDGYQNPSLGKNLHLLVIDGQRGFGNGLVFPAGPLREPLSMAFARASAIILIGDPSAQVKEALSDLTLPVFKATLTIQPPEGLANKVYAFAGIAFPDKFFQSLKTHGFNVIDTSSFPDHHAYDDVEYQNLQRKSRSLNASLVTTQKDYVRLSATQKRFVTSIPVVLEWEDEAVIKAFLKTKLSL